MQQTIATISLAILALASLFTCIYLQHEDFKTIAALMDEKRPVLMSPVELPDPGIVLPAKGKK